MSISRQLAKLVRAITFEQLSEEVVDRTKYLSLDYIGLAARGNTFESSQPILQLIEKLSRKDGVVVVGQPDLAVQAHYAALANGAASHSLELDDVINDASLHPAVVVFPTAFALAEELQLNGKHVIEASVAGYEVMGRLGKLLNPSKIYERGFHPTGVVGTFAAVATAGKLLKLSEDQLTAAFGIAGSQASASMEFLKTGSWTKRLHPGWAAHAGILACELAQNGFTGPESIIEGEFGFAHAYATGWHHPTDGLDQFNNASNAILKTSIKPHACCRYKQGPLDIILAYSKEKNLKPEAVKKISIYLVKTALPIVALPEEEKRNPQSSVDGQFSMHFGAAVAVVYQNTLLEQYEDTVTQEPVIKQLMQKVHCYHESELDLEFPAKWPAKVVIETTEEVFEATVEFPKGDPENPLTWDEMITKFKYVSQPVFNLDTQDYIVRNIRELEKLQTVNELATHYKGGLRHDAYGIKS